MSTAAGPRRRSVLGLVAGLGVLVALVMGLLLGRGLSDGPAPVDDAVSIGFAQDMKVHHAQAVEMSAILHRRSSDPNLAFLALDILTTQQGQIGILSGWLDLWGATQTTMSPPMSWMDGHADAMPGMATREQIAALERMPVAQMEEQFLRLMIEHHRGAVPMAAYAAEHADRPELAQLARGMERGQASEIALMQDLLVARGRKEQPEGADPHAGHG
jgi:uncharacterized protein (DUF305 family)